MQKEILEANPGSRIRLLAVNQIGSEGGNAEATAGGRTIPLLQDTEAAGAWTLWNVDYRDVVILDGDGIALGVFNLTDHNLSYVPEYDALLNYLRIRAGE